MEIPRWTTLLLIEKMTKVSERTQDAYEGTSAMELGEAVLINQILDMKSIISHLEFVLPNVEGGKLRSVRSYRSKNMTFS